MSPRARSGLPARRDEAGYSMVALLAAVTVMLIAMGVAAPAWKYVMKDDREQELIFRGGQIADAIRRYQAKNGNALPPTLEVLVKGKFLRKAFKDPMTKAGEWRLIRQGEPLAPPPLGGRPGASPSPSPSPSQPTGPAAGVPGPGGTIGAGFVGVASRSTEKSLRIFNGRDRYDQWFFIAGQQRIVGRQVVSPQQQPPGQQRPGAVQPRVAPPPGGGSPVDRR